MAHPLVRFVPLFPLFTLLACPVVAERAEDKDNGEEPSDSGDSDVGLDSGDGGDTADSACEEQTWYLDDDDDGFGWVEASFISCVPPNSYVADSTDCDDTRPDSFPGALETCDGADQDCDTVVDNDATDALVWYFDGDADGYGSPVVPPTLACAQPADHVATSDDCEDADIGIYPGALEHCDLTDEDCDTVIDNDAVDADSWYEDLDADGHGNAAVRTDACAAPAGTSADDLDCDDNNSAIFPQADERCDGIDEDCDGNIDENPIDPTTWYLDNDDDGFGTDTLDFVGCEPIDGYVSESTDCDDTDATIFPGAMDMCDGVDVDCDGTVDEADSNGAPTWYLDGDGDGYAGLTTTIACEAPESYYGETTDCDDADSGISPGANEICGGVDENCDGTIDETSASDATQWFADLDGDTYGDAASVSPSCIQPIGYVLDATDCNDADATWNPDGVEICADYLDQNCDGEADDGCWPVGTIATADAATEIWGTSALQTLGYSFAGGGDLTGDGVPDLVSLSAGGTSSTLYVLDAAAFAAVEAPGTAVLATRTLVDETAKPGMGDLDGDGVFDLLVGSVGSDYTLVEYGPIVGTAAMGTDAIIGADLGSFAFGDFNSDGVDDLVASVHEKNKVVLLTYPSGGTAISTGLTIRDARAGAASWLGRWIASGEDLDGDGLDDMVFGGDANEVWMFSGAPAGTDVSSADLTIAADATDDPLFGRYGVAISPDADGDGYGEIAAGSWVVIADTYQGQTYFFSGDLTGVARVWDAFANIVPDNEMPTQGISLAFADVDGDGKDDFITGGSGAEINQVGVFLSPLSGNLVGADADTFIIGNSENFAYPNGIVPTGDLLGLGYEGFAFGTINEDSSLTDVGAIYVFYGP